MAKPKETNALGGMWSDGTRRGRCRARPGRWLDRLRARIEARGSVVMRVPTAAFVAGGASATPSRIADWEREARDPCSSLAYLTPSGLCEVLLGERAIATAYLDGRKDVECEIVGSSGRRAALIAAVRLEVRKRRRPTRQIASLLCWLLPTAEVDATAGDYERLRKSIGLPTTTFDELIRVFCIADEVLALASEGRISDEVAVFLAAYEEEQDQVRLANLAAEKGWGARDLYALHKALPGDVETAADPEWVDRYWKNWIPGLMPAGSTTTGGK